MDLLVIHYVVIDEYFSEFKDGENEQRGVKDTSLFQSAVNEPKQTFNRQDLYPDVLSKAAVYLRSIATNHAFFNGNKRTALMAMIIFLEENGYTIIADPVKLYRLALAVVKSKPSIERIKAKYLKKYCRYTGSRTASSLAYRQIIRNIRQIFRI
ncbi:type II toxin-antitoxin system death-on-curing family toxin [Acididesulfobacillus acetoxydans]|uniref:type II toxin-antitoxin system death-on-curing family toxin n=1 Tax=Acididesulfobacillus acetoxydans TaxID=1561005 RepID=UPI0035586881